MLIGSEDENEEVSMRQIFCPWVWVIYSKHQTYMHEVVIEPSQGMRLAMHRVDSSVVVERGSGESIWMATVKEVFLEKLG